MDNSALKKMITLKKAIEDAEDAVIAIRPHLPMTASFADYLKEAIHIRYELEREIKKHEFEQKQPSRQTNVLPEMLENPKLWASRIKLLWDKHVEKG